MPELTTTLALIAAVLMVAALASGFVSRGPVTFPMLFLAIGVALSERGLDVIRIDVHSPALEAIAIISLSFVLYLDALSLRFDQLGKHWSVPVLSIGPGTLVTLAIVTVLASTVLGVSWRDSLLLGAVLSSMDPVVLRDVVHDRRIPRSIRLSLQTEAGTNDLVVLPIVLVLSAIALGHTGGAAGWLELLGRLFLLGPLAGLVVGFVGVWLIRLARRQLEVSRAYRALYGVGSVFAAYVAGEAVGGSGFLAVFASGVVVALLDDDLCDCFLEYGEATAEMAMLFAFILFGALLSTLFDTIAILPALLFALLVLLLARPIAIGVVLGRASLSRQARVFIAWAGPRGLSSLLFALLAVNENVPGATYVLAVAGVVVVVSVILTGASAQPVTGWYSRALAAHTLAEERVATAAGLFEGEPEDVRRIGPDALAAQLSSPELPIILDVRSRFSHESDGVQIPGSVRVVPDQVPEWAEGRDRSRPIVAYCT